MGRLTVSPCCSWNAPYYTADISDIFNQPEIVKHRKTNQETDKLIDQECRLCIDKVSDHWANRSGWHKIYDIRERRYDFTGPMHLSVKADIACNLACVTCSPTLSSRWRNELGIKGQPVRAKHEDLIKALSSMDVSNLQTLHIYGGETFLGNTTEVILDCLEQRLPEMTLWIDTNCTIQPSQRLLELMSKCKRVDLKLSIDAVGEQFEYIRYPAKWSKAEALAKHFNETLPYNFSLVLRPSIGILNAHLLDDLNSWYVKEFMRRPNGTMNKLEYYPIYGEFGLDNSCQEFFDDLKEKYPQSHRIHALLSMVGLRQHNINQAFKALDVIDSRRGTSWKKILPHLEKYHRVNI